MDKFGRNYILEISRPNEFTGNIDLLTVRPPFTIEFDITRNTLTSSNVAQIRVFNLDKNNRNQIRHNYDDFGLFQGVTLRGGYGSNLPIIFTGNISQAWSMREGVNFITQIESFDGGFANVNGQTNIQFPAGTLNRDVIINLASTLPRASVGAIGSFPGALGRGASFSGGTMDILRQLTGGAVFIDNAKVNALLNNEYIEIGSGIATIDSKSGLLGTPMLQKNIVTFDMLFEPSLAPGQKINLTSITEANFDGIYKVTSVKHRGMISDAVCGDVITTGELAFEKTLTGVATGG